MGPVAISSQIVLQNQEKSRTSMKTKPQQKKRKKTNQVVENHEDSWRETWAT